MEGASATTSLSGTTLRFTVVIGLLAVFFGRAMEQALPGSRSGLGRLLDANHWIAAFFTQLLAVLIITVAGRLTVMTSADQRVDYRHRIFMAPAASVVVCLTAFACLDVLLGPYTPELSLLLGIAGTLVALSAAVIGAQPAVTRAGAIILGLVAIASIAQLAARLLAMQASDGALPRQYIVSRWVASAGTLVDVASLVVAAVWIVRRDRLGRIYWLGACGLTVLTSIFAQRGNTPKANFLEVLVSRLLAQLHREPSAVLPRLFLNAQETFALVIAAWLIRRPRSAPPELRACLSLILLARSSPDIPLCAGLLVTGALGLSAIAAGAQQIGRVAACTEIQDCPLDS
jgi:hypothetical protein